jgi:triphosphoribosyl-dephospho-CoA synthase
VSPLHTSESVARAFHDACLAELDALKPGNVHRFGDDAPNMSVADFEASARVAAPCIAMPILGVGARIRLAVEATIDVVGHNTNLGIVLLAAPLAQGALDARPGTLRERLARVLAGLSVEDARETYAAIRHARPGGLGEAPEHDVSAEPSITLLEAMRVAAARDRIAWNYTHNFADIFDLGLGRLEAARARALSPSLATTSVYLGFLATVPDTLIARKFGNEKADQVRREAQAVAKDMAETPDQGVSLAKLAAFDRALKQKGVNPGTSADLTVATLFAAALEDLERRV